ncbi:MAG: O-antigen ligase family protein [Lachnospiraceae bacterium]|nr:O-antigen ligase family protein [Lachnospiraceae bacterium]MBR1851657.1 O-antigen ligase family protein [Lachnospiraceae bacterium]
MTAIEAKKNKRITLNYIIVGMLCFIPIVDTLNGYLIKGSNISGIGTIYRLAYFAIVLTYILKKPRKFEFYLIFDFFVFLVFQFTVSGTYWRDSVELTVKLFMPLFMITLFKGMVQNKTINIGNVIKLMDFLAIVFPLTVLIPFVFGIGYSTYRGGVGYKAFYYATNEISFSICVMIMYLWSRLIKKMSFKHMILYLNNALCCIIIGSKVVTGALFLFSFLLIWNNFIFAGKKVSAKRLLLVFVIIGGIVGLYNTFSSQVDAIINRWITNQSVAETNIAFLTSHRNVYLQKGFELFKSKGGLTYLFGWGLGGANNGMVNIEMDLFDILFSCGILGLLNVLYNYIALIKAIKFRSKEAILFLTISIVLSFVGGHVLFTGLGGMMFAIMMLYSISLNDLKKEVFEMRKASKVPGFHMH